MSFGWVNPDAGVAGAGGTEAAVVRGPIASQVVQQLLLGTDWGELDYLILDMPPGTGDVQITVAQHARLTGALVVSTPSKLAHVDVIKGVEMFEKMHVPTIAVVENMAYLDSGETRLYPFGSPGKYLDALMDKVPSCDRESSNFQIPVHEALHASVESGVPLFDTKGTDDSITSVKNTFSSLANLVIKRVYSEQFAVDIAPAVRWDENRGVVVRWIHGDDANEAVIDPALLRNADPVDGTQIHPTASHTHPIVSIEPRGNFAVRIKWQDGFEIPFFTHKALFAVIQSMKK